MSFSISPSLSAGCLLDLGAVLERLGGLSHIHLDIDDGNFVHGITFGTDTVKLVAEHTDVPLDVHLEVNNPLDYVDELGDANVSALCAHVEALPFPSEFIGACRNAGIGRVGLALNVKTPVDALAPYAHELDYVILVSVEADRRGLRFQPGVLDKARQARNLLPATCSIWMDGAIREELLPDVVAAGVDGIVVGRAVFQAEDPVAAERGLRERAEQLQGGTL